MPLYQLSTFSLTLNPNVDSALASALNTAAGVRISRGFRPGVDTEEILRKLGELEAFVNRLYA
jgi:hypothetical protein